MMRSMICGFVVAGALLLMTTSAWAHHSHAAYDTTKVEVYEGVVTQIKWMNPHMFVAVDIPDANGKVVNWGFEGGGATGMVAAGVSPKVLKVGNKVKIIGSPSRDADKHLALFVGMEVDGKIISRGLGTNVLGSIENGSK